MSLKSEITSQGEVLDGLLDRMDEFQRVAQEIRKRKIAYVFLAARGTSDNAGLYAKYLWGTFNRLPIALAAPSLFSMYHSPPVLTDALVVGISQSGQSPDIVGVLAEGRNQGALTMAITNDSQSPLAQTADLGIDIRAGLETAVAATKTYTAQLLAIALLSLALNYDKSRMRELEKIPDFVRTALSMDSEIERISERYRYMERCVVLGRGYNYATAYEWALKLKEMAYILAIPYSSADFQHGPIAMVSKGFPVLAIVPRGSVCENMLAQINLLKEKYEVELVTISNHPDALSLAASPIVLPEELPEWLSPITAIVPAQLFSYHLTKSKGLDPDTPRGLSKVTLTK